MSIELAISENTAAIKELIGVWAKLLKQGKTVNAQVEAGERTTVTAGNVEIEVAAPPKSSKAAPTPTATVTATPAPAVTAPAEPVAASPSEISYDTVSKAITEMVKADRPRAIAALTKFGVAKGPQLKVEQYADFLAELA